MHPDEAPEAPEAREGETAAAGRPRRRRQQAARAAREGAAPVPSAAAKEEADGESPRPRRKRTARRSGRRGRGGRKTAGATPDGVAEGAPTGDGAEAEADADDAAGARRGRRRSRRRTRRPDADAPAASDAPVEVDASAPPHGEGVTEGEAEGEPASEAGVEAEAPTAPVEKVLLINASDAEEVRIALLEDGQVEELYIEVAEERTATGNVYRGRVQNVEKGIGAAFVELGRALTGFLHVSDIPDRAPGATISDLLEAGQEVLVQITRDRIGKKGPALSGRIALAGRYLVLLANTPRSGVSRRIPRGRTRDRARKILDRLEVPEGMGLIVRTAGEGSAFEDLERDLRHLLSEWEALQERAARPGSPGLLRAESDLAERSVRDIMPRDLARLVVDREDVAARVRSLLDAWYGKAPDAAGEEDGGAPGRAAPEVVVHLDPMPLFHAYGAEPQLEEAFRRTLRLPSGGSVVIDPTEALVAIDVNSGRSTDEEDPDATALQTNLEAVETVARQLRLRDLGGLVVVDLIDMRDRRNVRTVERAFKKALARDRARIRVGRIGSFGCITLSRQRIRQALSRVTHEECPECGGTGRRRNPEGLGLRVLREMQARAARARGRGGLEVRVPKPVYDWIQRHRVRVLRELEKSCSGPIRLQADDRLSYDGWAMKGLPPTGKAR